MICPYCGEDKNRVVDTRSATNENVTIRQRWCRACNRVFKTTEREDLEEPERKRRVLT